MHTRALWGVSILYVCVTAVNASTWPAWHPDVQIVICNRAGTGGNGVAVSSKAAKGKQRGQVPNGKSASPSQQDGTGASHNSGDVDGDPDLDPDTDAGNQQSDYTDGDDAGNNDSDSDYSEEEDDDEDYRGGGRRGAAGGRGKQQQQQQRPQRGSAQVASDTERSRKRPNWKEPPVRPENARVASLRSSRPPPPPKPPKPPGGGGGGGGGKRSGSRGTASRQGSGALGAGGDSEAGEAAGAGGRSRAGSRGPGGSSAAGDGGEEAADYSEGSGSESGSGSGSESEGDADNPAILERVVGEEAAKAAVDEVAGMWEVSRLSV